MKWIGQHIYDFISRFRNDIFLESSIATEDSINAFLGVDSNNKIVSRTASQLLSDISAGDITAVTITTDSGGGSAASETSGSADFSILGSSGVGVTNTGTTINIRAEVSEIDHDSLQNFVAAEHYRWDTDISSTAQIHRSNVPTLNQNTTGQSGTVATIDGLAPNTATTAAAQPNITSLGTLTALTVDNINLDDKTITITGDTNDTLTIVTGAAGATTVTTTDATLAEAHFEIAADGNITLDAAGDIALEAAGDDITMEAAHITLESTAANDPTVTVQNTADDTNSPRLRFFKRREDGGTLQVGEDGDGVGEILFNSYDDNSPTPSGTNYAKIEGFIHDATNGQESGQLKLQVASHDGGVETGLQLTGGDADTEVDVTIGNGASSETTIAGNLSVTGNIIGKQYRIYNTSFRADIGTTKYYIPLKSQDEQTVLTREEVSELAVADGRVVSVTLRVENLNTHSGDATVTFGVETNTVGSNYTSFSSVETEALTINNADDQHLFHYVFDTAKHWDSTDMWAISLQSDTDISGNNERFFVTVVVEDDWSTYLGGVSREIDTTP